MNRDNTRTLPVENRKCFWYNGRYRVAIVLKDINALIGTALVYYEKDIPYECNNGAVKREGIQRRLYNQII